MNKNTEDMEMNEEIAPREEFKKLLEEILSRVEKIDALVEWSISEPEWWLMMSSLERQAAQYNKALSQ